MLPRIVIVLGKGGVGRSTTAAALGLALAARGRRSLIVEWSLAGPIAPWFGRAAPGPLPVEIAPRLSVMDYELDDTLRRYFVDHLHLGFFYRRIIDGPHVRRFIDGAPGFAELMFVGHLWWLTTLAPSEAGLTFDHVIADVPATGHGASLLDMPATLASFGTGGLLSVEIDRVTSMMADPSWTGAIVVSSPEQLAVIETLELVPRVTAAMKRRPIAAIINRSPLVGAGDRAWIARAAAGLPRRSRDAMLSIDADLSARMRASDQLRRALEGATERGTIVIGDQVLERGDVTPLDVARAASSAIGPVLGDAA